MAEDNQNKENENNEPEEQGADVFGEEPKEEAEKSEEGDDKGEGKGEEKKYDPIPEDHPIIKGLNDQIESLKQDKSTMGGNLSEQGKLIKKLEKEKADLLGGKKDVNKEGEIDLIFKEDEIKTSKDLSEKERDEMTETELKQFDEIASMKKGMNKLYEALHKGSKEKGGEEGGGEEGGEDKGVEDLNTAVKTAAKKLATGEDGKENTEMANQIIESFKLMKFNTEGLSDEEIAKRVEIAAKEVPNYTPPKEQKGGKGGAVKEKGKSDDPFGVDKIVEEATTGQDGSYDL